jgi:hypothetical protein
MLGLAGWFGVDATVETGDSNDGVEEDVFAWLVATVGR